MWIDQACKGIELREFDMKHYNLIHHFYSFSSSFFTACQYFLVEFPTAEYGFAFIISSTLCIF